jgi:hypothetical protein
MGCRDQADGAKRDQQVERVMMWLKNYLPRYCPVRFEFVLTVQCLIFTTYYLVIHNATYVDWGT